MIKTEKQKKKINYSFIQAKSLIKDIRLKLKRYYLNLPRITTLRNNTKNYET